MKALKRKQCSDFSAFRNFIYERKDWGITWLTIMRMGRRRSLPAILAGVSRKYSLGDKRLRHHFNKVLVNNFVVIKLSQHFWSQNWTSQPPAPPPPHPTLTRHWVQQAQSQLTYPWKQKQQHSTDHPKTHWTDCVWLQIEWHVTKSLT